MNLSSEMLNQNFFVKEFIEKQVSLLESEKECIEQRELEDRKKYGDIYGTVLDKSEPPYGGVIISLKLVITADVEGLGNPFKQGTPLGIEIDGTNLHLMGLVTIVRNGEIDVHVKAKSSAFNLGTMCKLDSTDSGELDLLINTMKTIKESKLRDILLWFRRPNFHMYKREVDFIDQYLDQSQRAAVTLSLQQKDLSLIYGPPGTGKTRTLVEIIRQEVRSGKKVLFSAASNTAVDNMAERLQNEGMNIIRLGNPARVTEKVQSLTIDIKLIDLQKKLQALEDELSRTNNGSRHYDALKAMVEETRTILGGLINYELKNASVVLGTLVTCSKSGPLKHLPEDHFQVTMVDECSQAKEASCWILVPRTTKLILAGDYHQLPPVIHNRNNENELTISLFERLLRNGLTNKCSSKLIHQYRMNQLIMRWPSAKFYLGQLIAAPSVANCSLSDMDSVEKTQETKSILYLVDTAMITGDKYEKNNNKSFLNEVEAIFVMEHFFKLIDAGVRTDQIGIITPYSSQRELLVANLQEDYPDLEIQSVDGFQGREKEAIIISLVRSNNHDGMGFIGDQKRLNVAITRAKKHLTIICDTETVASSQKVTVIREFLMYVKKHGTVRRPRPLDVNHSLLKTSKHSTKLFLTVSHMARSNAIKEDMDRSKIIGIDCEMVKCTDNIDILAKVAIVTDEETLLDTFVRTDLQVLDYGTEVSGVREEDLIDAPHIDEVIPMVRNILNNASIIVGHGLEHDMEVLGINFPPKKVRDTAHYRPYLKNGGRSSKLKDLAKKHLGKIIQTGEHDPTEDAKAALFLYYKMMNSWEAMIRNKEGARQSIQDFNRNNFATQNRFEVLNNIDEDGSESSDTVEVFLSRRGGEPATVSSDEE